MKKTNFICTLIISMLFISCATTNKVQKTKGEVSMKDLTIEKEGKTIFGQLYLPGNTNEKFPLVIMSHGYNGSYVDFSADARFFAENGYACYAYDFCGGSNRSRSSGKSFDMTIYSEKQDLLDVFEYFKSQDYIDSENIYLMGASQGGFVSALSAAELQSKVKALILLYPALCIPDNWNSNFKTEEEIPEVLNFWGMNLGKNFFVTVRQIDVYNTIKKYEGPVYISHGTNDQIVPLSYSEKAKKEYKNARLTIMNGEGHGFTPNAALEVRNYALKFIK